MKKNNNISIVVENYMCNSCGACYSSCKSGAIDYQETVGGYIFPKIDKNTCTDCGICLKVCPGLCFGESLRESLPSDHYRGNVEGCFVGKATDPAIFENSQSGGIVSAIISYLFKTSKIDVAILAVMKKEIPPRGDVLIIRSEKEIALTQKSKYTPIPILKALKEIVKTNDRFAIVGLSCHIHGLFNYLDLFKSLKNSCILKIGLVCDRVLTTVALDFLICNHSKIENATNIVFRDKNKPCYPGNIVICSDDGDEIVLPPKHRMALKEFFTPARCRICFDKMNVFSDITVCDPHGIQGVDRIRGESAIIVRTRIGEGVIACARKDGDVILRDVQPEEIFEGQNIDRKRKYWTQFISSWNRFIGVTPDYGRLETNISPSTNRKADKLLKRSLVLNKFKDRKKLILFYSILMKLNFLRRVFKKIVRTFSGYELFKSFE